MSFLPLLFNIGLEVLASVKKQEEKGYTDWKSKVKLSLFIDNSVVYVENPKQSTKKLPELISEFIKIIGYIAIIQKSNMFLYSSSDYLGHKGTCWGNENIL